MSVGNHNGMDAIVSDDFEILICAYCDVKRTQVERYIDSKHTKFSLLSAKLFNIINLCIIKKYYGWIGN